MRSDPNFYKVDRESFLETRPLGERLSCFYLDYDYTYPEFYTVGNTYLLRSFHSLFNFVSGENSPSLVIVPETTRSFCSLVDNKIQLGTAILDDDRITQSRRVDSMYAVMLHELWHKRYTVRDLAARFRLDFYYDNPRLKAEITKLLPSQTHVDILNVLEDHRIERLGLQEFPGYVFYFDELREYVVKYQQHKKLSLVSPAGLCIEYLMFKVLIPELLPWFVQKIHDLYGVVTSPPPMTRENLEKVWEKFDLYIKDNPHTVYSDSLDDLLEATKALVEMIPKDVRDQHTSSGRQFAGTHTEFVFEIGDGPGNSDAYLDIVSELLSSLAGEAEKIAKDVDTSGASDDSKVRVEKLGIVDALDKNYDDVWIYSPVARDIDRKLITEAKTISKHISRDLGFLASKLNQIREEFELSEGDLDEDELYSIGYNKNLFKDEEQTPGFELDFGIVLDESGSMAEDEKIRRAIAACLGIVLACVDAKHVNLFVYGHSNGRHRHNGHYGVELYEYINTKRGIRNWKNILAAQGQGGNADGYAIAKVGEIMLRDSQAKQKVLVVISDGLPAAAGYGGPSAEKHVWQVNEMLERKGIEVIQLCIDNIESSAKMFKNFIPFDPAGNFGKDLREIMQRKLQQFMDSF